MRYKADHKEKTRLKILGAAGRSFRRYGYSGIGVDGLAKAAGVTSGAFYAHFSSKDAAFDAALAEGLDEVIEAVPNLQKEHGTGWVKAFSQYYLSKQHRGDRACGCAMATLTPEVVRFAPRVRTAYEKKMSLIADLVAQGLVGGSESDRRDRAWSMLGVLIGGVSMARAMKSVKAAEEVAHAIEEAAVKVAGRARGASSRRA